MTPFLLKPGSRSIAKHQDRTDRISQLKMAYRRTFCEQSQRQSLELEICPTITKSSPLGRERRPCQLLKLESSNPTVSDDTFQNLSLETIDMMVEWSLIVK